jgi:hypothetical protein
LREIGEAFGVGSNHRSKERRQQERRRAPLLSRSMALKRRLVPTHLALIILIIVNLGMASH